MTPGVAPPRAICRLWTGPAPSGLSIFVMECSPEILTAVPDANFNADPDGLTFLQALGPQLGLRLVSQTALVDRIVSSR